ncbi:hypothetical protein PR048_001142 [Dryococelus australis]|uniref:Uncharacterized protein n=1 Tax=Dryococelus australis TaxID=614101 RepID=A0ABQ9IGI3_9NEOP|nr:hypothetical protein PR048_001142 [Dryococelus australis]
MIGHEQEKCWENCVRTSSSYLKLRHLHRENFLRWKQNLFTISSVEDIPISGLPSRGEQCRDIAASVDLLSIFILLVLSTNINIFSCKGPGSYPFWIIKGSQGMAAGFNTMLCLPISPFWCGNISVRCSQNAGLAVDHLHYQLHLSGRLEAVTSSHVTVHVEQRYDMVDNFKEAVRQAFQIGYSSNAAKKCCSEPGDKLFCVVIMVGYRPML